ncbi:GH116 family glycosyl hydrolase [Georgenia alba]|uniref:GH116 family glycosyl hydrolase n=1 Tax=Georgenia alba TaxID=2233858 RepID=A0ABW2Q8I6_9MICO
MTSEDLMSADLPDTTCCGPGEVSRRSFIALTAATGTLAVGPGVPAGAETRPVPARTDLDPAWLERISARGTPTEYTGEALSRIGMPVGGLTTGQVYLAGDGRTWLWDVFNADAFRYGGDDWQGRHYAEPLDLDPVFTTGFALRWGDGAHTRRLDAEGFSDVRFRGRYPIGHVELRDAACPLEVDLDAFSPFVPTRVADSSLPATVFEYTLRNTSPDPVSAELLGIAENPVCLDSRRGQPIVLTTSALGADAGAPGLQHGARGAELPEPRPDVAVENWEDGYGAWTATGAAFGDGPVTQAEAPDYFVREGDLGADGRFVTSHNWRDASAPADDHTGRLTSEPFTLERRYLAASIGGGNRVDAGLHVVVDGEVVARLTGNNSEIMRAKAVDVSAWAGRTARIELVDEGVGGWAHVNCDRIWQTDTPLDPRPVEELPDGGTFALAAFDPAARVRPSIAAWDTPEAWFDAEDGPAEADAGNGSLAGTVTVAVDLAPGEERTVRFALAWHFPTISGNRFGYIDGSENLRRHYGERYADVSAVVADLADRGADLSADTHAFVRTWYDDATLPVWFLERTLSPASTLATGTCLRFHDGRFYAWEGIYCCDGTCTHVWNYAQSVARLFPELERDTRERVDLGLSFHADTGAIDYRGEADRRVAHDGQCGNVLRTYREHQMSPDGAFLERVWPRVRKATEYLIGHDGEPDGVLEGAQYNTLDATWYGEIPWITGLYVAALRAAAEMADDVGDAAFASRCRTIAEAGTAYLDTSLWNEEYGYYEHVTDPAHAEATSSNRGCHIDQMFGQTYAHQLGLPRVVDESHARTALESIVRNNHLPDAQSYMEESGIEGGRTYSTEGEPGTVMCTWPFGGSDIAPGEGEPTLVAYFNEVWTGQEYQLAAHLFAEGMVGEALTVVHAVHERYSAGSRNPYNEVECSDHYTRAMMSHAAYLAATGYGYHGPRGYLRLAPRLGDPAEVAAAFTVAEGWGLYRQRRTGHQQRSELELRHGRLRLRTFATEVPDRPGNRPAHAEVVDGHGGRRRVDVEDVTVDGAAVTVTLAEEVELSAGQTLVVTVR